MFQQVSFFLIKFTFDKLLCTTGRTSSTSTSATVRSSGPGKSTERTISSTFVYYPEKVKREAPGSRINDGAEAFSTECTVPLVVLIGVASINLVVFIVILLKITNK